MLFQMPCKQQNEPFLKKIERWLGQNNFQAEHFGLFTYTWNHAILDIITRVLTMKKGQAMAEPDFQKNVEDHIEYVKEVYGERVEAFLDMIDARTATHEERVLAGVGFNLIRWRDKLYPILARLTMGHGLGEACKLHKFSQGTLWHYRKQYKDTLDTLIKDCLDDGFSVLEEEARRRAVDGVKTYVISAGKLVLDPKTGEPITEQKYSDNVLMFLMRSKKPEIYGERRSVDLSGSVNVQGAGETLLEKLAPIFAGLDELLDNEVDDEGSEETGVSEEPEEPA